MIWRDEYDIGTIISAIVTLLVILLSIRFVLYLANRKRPKIQKPDWLDDDRFTMDRKKRR